MYSLWAPYCRAQEKKISQNASEMGKKAALFRGFFRCSTRLKHLQHPFSTLPARCTWDWPSDHHCICHALRILRGRRWRSTGRGASLGSSLVGKKMGKKYENPFWGAPKMPGFLGLKVEMNSSVTSSKHVHVILKAQFWSLPHILYMVKLVWSDSTYCTWHLAWWFNISPICFHVSRFSSRMGPETTESRCTFAIWKWAGRNGRSK